MSDDDRQRFEAWVVGSYWVKEWLESEPNILRLAWEAWQAASRDYLAQINAINAEIAEQVERQAEWDAKIAAAVMCLATLRGNIKCFLSMVATDGSSVGAAQSLLEKQADDVLAILEGK